MSIYHYYCYCCNYFFFWEEIIIISPTSIQTLRNCQLEECVRSVEIIIGIMLPHGHWECSNIYQDRMAIGEWLIL